MKKSILFLSITIASGVLVTNLYNTFIDAKSWGTDIPHSIATAREYFKVINPGNFFRIFSPINQIIALLALVAFWKQISVQARLFLGIALSMYVIGDIMTFVYFYPRNDFMFRDASLDDAERLKTVWMEWRNMTWVRSAVVFAGLCFSWLSLHFIYQKQVTCTQ